MSKNTPKITKEELKQPDMFVSSMTNSWHAVEKYRGAIAAVLIVAFVGAAGFVGYDYLHARQERNAQNELFPLQNQYLKLREDYDKAKFKTLMPEKTKEAEKAKAAAKAAKNTAKNDPKNQDAAAENDAEDTAVEDEKADAGKPASGNLQADYGDLVGKLEAFVLSHDHRRAGAEAALILSDLYSEYKMPAKAAELLAVPVQHLSHDEFLYYILNIALGNAQASQGDCKNALLSWQHVLDNSANTFLHPEVSLKSGICYETLGDGAQAKKMYLEASKDSSSGSSTAQTAKSLLRALEVKESTAKKG